MGNPDASNNRPSSRVKDSTITFPRSDEEGKPRVMKLTALSDVGPATSVCGSKLIGTRAVVSIAFAGATEVARESVEETN